MQYVKSKAKSVVSDPEKLSELVSKALHDMATIVGSTLGPGGRAVLIERENMAPLVTKDGVTVAKSLGVENAELNTIIEAAKEIAINTAEQAGDGTTTSLVLADALITHGQAFLKNNKKYGPQKLVNELQQAYDTLIVPFLKDNAVKATTEDELLKVAKISANGDEEISRAAVSAVMAAGEDGHVLIEETQGGSIRVENIDGFIVTTGLKELGQIGPVFINDKANQQVKMSNGLVVLYDGAINDLKVPAQIESAVADENGQYDGSPIVIFAHSFSDVVLDRFAKLSKGGSLVAPIKTPRSGLPNGSSMFLHDMAAFTGATVFDPGTIETLEDEEGIGSFTECKINMYETVIYSESNIEKIEARVEELKAIHDAAFSAMDKSHIKSAISKLVGGISTIWVGGGSDLEIREKKARVDDAVRAVRAAIAEGIIPGGCSVHLRLASLLDQSLNKKPSWDILVRALRHPFTVLMFNCGEDHEEILATWEEKLKSANVVGVLPIVFDADEHRFVDPFEAGIIEPAKVCRVSIGNALSVTSLLITLGGIVVVPRDASMEQQLELTNQAFKNMLNTAGE